MVKVSFYIPVNLYLDYYLRYERILKIIARLQYHQPINLNKRLTEADYKLRFTMLTTYHLDIHKTSPIYLTHKLNYIGRDDSLKVR